MTPVIIEQSKPSANKKSWTNEEDQMLIQLVIENGDDGKWSHIAKKMDINRTGKQCRERYHNHLKPEIKKGNWSKEEDALIIELSKKIGNQWARISKFLPGRSDNAIKNRFHAILNRKSSDPEFDAIYLMHDISHSKLSSLLKPEVLETISKAADIACININVSNDTVKIDLNLLFHNHQEYQHEYCEYEEHYDYDTVNPPMIVSPSDEKMPSRTSSSSSTIKNSSSSDVMGKIQERQQQSFSPKNKKFVTFQTPCEGPNSNSSQEWENIGYDQSISYDTFFNSPREIMKTLEENWLDDLLQLVDNPDKEIPTFSLPSSSLPFPKETENHSNSALDNNIQDQLVDKYTMKMKKLSYHSPNNSPAHPFLKKMRSTYPLTTSVKRTSPVYNSV